METLVTLNERCPRLILLQLGVRQTVDPPAPLGVVARIIKQTLY